MAGGKGVSPLSAAGEGGLVLFDLVSEKSRDLSGEGFAPRREVAALFILQPRHRSMLRGGGIEARAVLFSVNCDGVP